MSQRGKPTVTKPSMKHLAWPSGMKTAAQSDFDQSSTHTHQPLSWRMTCCKKGVSITRWILAVGDGAKKRGLLRHRRPEGGKRTKQQSCKHCNLLGRLL
jgi:hypothetical protein